MASLREKTLSGMLWSLTQNIGSQGISFVVFIFLARLLTPEIFGLTGMLAVFIELSQVLLNAGFSKALIQKKDADNEDASSVFWINLVISFILYGILFFTAPLIAEFYDQPILTSLTRWLSLVFVINAFSLVPQALLTKSMHFKKITFIQLPSSIFGGIVGIVMAYLNFGVWSLVGLRLATGVSTAVQFWIYARWKPLFTFNKEKAQILFSFGGKLMIAKIINRIFSNAYLIAIGKFFPVSFVGYYNISFKYVKLPASTVSNALNNVTFSAFSTIQDDKERLKRGFRTVIQQVFFLVCPAFVLGGILANPLFSFVLTDKWLPAVPYFQILCVVGIFMPLTFFNSNIINVKGRSDINLKIVIIARCITAIGIVGGIFLGIWALLIFQAVGVIINYFIFLYFSSRLIDYPAWEQLKDILPIFILSLFVGVIVYFVNFFILQWYDWIQLILGFGIGGSLYLLIARWKKLEPYLEILIVCKSKFPKLF